MLGYVLGGLSTKPLAAALGTPDLLFVWAATLVVAAFLGGRLLAATRRLPEDAAVRPSRRGRERSDRAAATRVPIRAHSSLMRWLALASVLFSLLFFSLYLPFSRAATERYPRPDELAGFFGLFFGLSTGSRSSCRCS